MAKVNLEPTPIVDTTPETRTHPVEAVEITFQNILLYGPLLLLLTLGGFFLVRIRQTKK